MGIPINVLILEDRPADAELMVHELQKAGFDLNWQRVETEADFKHHLDPALDLILADYNLPQFTGLQALDILAATDLDIPVIVVTGMMEETALECLRMGAVDYLLKDRMGRLGSAVKNALEERRILEDRKNAIEALRASEQRYRGVAETAATGLAIMDPEEIFTYTNPAFTTLLGYTREELLGMSFNQIVSPEEYPLIEDQKDYHKKGIGTQYETIMIRKDGKSRHVIVSTTPLTSKDGEDEGTQLVIADLTERKLAETELLESESRYRNLVESAPDGIVSTNKTGKILSVNESFLKLTGYENSDFIGRSFLKIPTLITQDLDFYARVVKDLLQGKITGTIQFNWKHANGEIKKGEAKASIQKVNDKIVGLQAIIRDVTERMQAEEDIQKNISRLDALRNIDQAIMGSLDLDLTLKIILDNLLPQLDVDAAVVLQYQEDIQTLQFSQGLGFKTAALQYTDLRLGHGYAGKVGLQRDHIFIPDLNHEEDKFLDFPQIKKEDFVSYYGVPLNAKGKLVGVLEIFHRSTLNPDDDWVNYLKLLAGQIAIAIDNVTLFNDLQRSNIDLTLAYDATIEGWAHALELKDMETEGHSRRVVSLSLDLAQALGISAEKMVHIRRGALLHDIGKMGVPDAILQKPGKLNDEEWQIMRQHPVYTLDWLYPIEYLRPALEIPYSHHERWDGTGYPRGIKGELIPLAARIFAIVDVWDALTSDRPYRKAWSREKTLAHIKEQSGKHFDPLVVEKFLEILKNDESK